MCTKLNGPSAETEATETGLPRTEIERSAETETETETFEQRQKQKLGYRASCSCDPLYVSCVILRATPFVATMQDNHVELVDFCHHGCLAKKKNNSACKITHALTHRQQRAAARLNGTAAPIGARRRSLGRRPPGVRSHCRSRNRGTEYATQYGMKWMCGSTRRQ
jgi:hypothetical protein